MGHSAEQRIRGRASEGGRWDRRGRAMGSPAGVSRKFDWFVDRTYSTRLHNRKSGLTMVRALSNDNDSAAGSVRFTPSSATVMLPLVRRIVADMVRLQRAIAVQQEQIKGIDRLPETIERAAYQEELRDIRGSLSDDETRLRMCIEELAALGLQPHLPIDGTVDFPALMNRRLVRLCWHPDDERVEHWHENGESFRDRKKVDPHSFGR